MHPQICPHCALPDKMHSMNPTSDRCIRIQMDALRAEVEALKGTMRCMTETAAENSRVHIEMHNQIVALQDQIQREGRMIEAQRGLGEQYRSRVAELEAELADTQARFRVAESLDLLDHQQPSVLQARVAELEAALTEIANYAQERSQGPTVFDALWGVRSKALMALRGEEE